MRIGHLSFKASLSALVRSTHWTTAGQSYLRGPPEPWRPASQPPPPAPAPVAHPRRNKVYSRRCRRLAKCLRHWLREGQCREDYAQHTASAVDDPRNERERRALIAAVGQHSFRHGDQGVSGFWFGGIWLAFVVFICNASLRSTAAFAARLILIFKGPAERLPHPPTPTPPDQRPNASLRANPRALSRSGFFFVARPHKKKPRQWGGVKVASDTESGRAREITRPVALPTVGRRARLFPDFNPLRSAPATADNPNAQASAQRGQELRFVREHFLGGCSENATQARGAPLPLTTSY
jgi:hypothetical protein